MTAHGDAGVALDGGRDGAVQPAAHVGQHLLAVDRGRQPGQRPGARGHGDGGDGGQLSPPDLGLPDRPAQGLARRVRTVDADDDAPHGRVLGALDVTGDDDRRAVRVGGQRGGDGAQQPVGEASPAPGAHDGEGGLVGQVDQHPGGVPGLERTGHGHALALGARDGLVDDGLRARADRGVVERGVSAVERGGGEGGEGVGAQDVDAPAAAGRAGDGPVHRAEGLR